MPRCPGGFALLCNQIYIGFCLIGGDTRSVKEPGQVYAYMRPETNERKEDYKTWGVEMLSG